MYSRWNVLIFLILILVYTPLQVSAQDSLVEKMDKVLSSGIEEGHWQVTADDVYMWLKTQKTDFIVVDVRPGKGRYEEGHIPGSIYIPYNRILKAENLKKLPKDKKVILVCDSGQVQNLPIIPLRVLGYNAYTMRLGYTSWIKDYPAGEMMQSVIDRAAEKNYPLKR